LPNLWERSWWDTRARDLSVRALSFLVLLAVTSLLAPTAADADLWGHLTFGRDITRDRWVHTTDSYSFTSDRPWINHEWAAEVLMWTFYAVGGATGLIALKLIVACCVGVVVLAVWRRHTLTAPWRDALLFTTALGLWPQFATIRPQIFSLLLLGVLLVILERFREGHQKWSLAIPLVFVVWVNVHGGWIIGAAVFTIFVACSVFDAEFDRYRRLLLIAAALASAIGTLVNPYGVRMLAFLFETVGPDRADIVEWQPLLRVPATALVLWCVPTALAAAAVWRNRRTIPISSLLITLVLGVGTFRVVRLLGFYALTVGMLLAPYVRSAATEQKTRPAHAPIWYAAAVSVLIVSLALVLFARRIGMQATWLPEADAAVFVRTHALTGRMLTWFDYGEYAIWHFSPRLRVSMDGRRETVYSDDMRALHWRIYRNEPSALHDLARLDPEYVWLPVDFPIVARLKAGGWRQIFKGSRSVLLGREGVDSILGLTVESETRYFPGP
ncbi:MAG: hypothetical protein ACREQF_07165, partial [Candidatus Binataceae bacterium]